MRSTLSYALRGHFLRLILLLMACGGSVGVWGQFNTPTINGTIAAGEYGTHTNGQNQQGNVYMTWDATNLYIGIINANVAEGAVVYLDINPIVPVNGGTNVNGTNVGFNYDGTNFAELPFRADRVLYFKNGYREYRIADGFNNWSAATTAFGAYAESGGNSRELSIPWTDLGGLPAAFNWYGYVTSVGGSVYNQVPANNPAGIIGTTARNSWYYTVRTTANGDPNNKPFANASYAFNSATDINNFGAITCYDFTMNTAGRQIARLSTGGDWTITGNLVVRSGTVFFGSGGSGYGQTTVNQVSVLGTGSLNMDQTNKVLSVSGNINISSSSANALVLSGASGGDLYVGGNFTKTAGTFNCNTRQLRFTGAGNQAYSSNVTENINFLRNAKSAGTLNINSSVNLPTSGNTAVFDANTSTVFAAGTTITLATGTIFTANNTGSTVTINGTMDNSGNATGLSTTLNFSSTGIYNHNQNGGTVLSGTWAVTSNCNITGVIGNLPTGFNQSFGNLTWNATGQTADLALNLPGNPLFAVVGTFNMQSTGSGRLFFAENPTNYTAAIANFNITGGTLYFVRGITLAGTYRGTVNTSGNYIQTGGTVELGNGSSGDRITVATFNLTGNFTQSGGTFRLANTAPAATSPFNTSLNISGVSSSMNLSTGSILEMLVGGAQGSANPEINLTGTGSSFVHSGGTFNFSTASANGGGILNVAGTFNRTGGTFTETGGGNGLVNFVGTANQAVMPGTPSNIINFRINNPAGITLSSNLIINNGATFFRTAGSITGAVVAYSAIGGSLSYDGSAAITTTDAEWPSASNPPVNVEINNIGGITLHNTRTILNTFTLTNGVLTIGNNNLTISNGNSTALVGSGFSTSKMILQNGTGLLQRVVGTTPGSFIFPVGEATGTTEYSPITFNFSSNSVARTLSVRAIDADPPNFATPFVPLDYISRYWTTAVSTNAGTYAYTTEIIYVPATDFQSGTIEANLRVSKFNGSTDWTDFTSTLSSPTLTGTASMTESNGGQLQTGEVSARLNVQAYVWNGSISSDYGTAANWTPAAVPPTGGQWVVNGTEINPLIMTDARTIAVASITNTGNFQMSATSQLTVSGGFNFTGSVALVLNEASTVILNNTASTGIPAIAFGNLNASGGNRVLPNGATVGIKGSFTPGAGTYTITGSTIEFSGGGAQTINAFNFQNLIISGNRGGGLITLAAGTTQVAGTFTASLSNYTSSITGNTFNFSSAASQTIPAFFYNNITNTGNGPRVWNSTGIVDLAGSLTSGTGVYTYAGSTVRYSGSGSYNLPVFTGSPTTTNQYNNLVISGTGTYNMGNTQGVAGNFTLAAGTLNVAITATPGILNVAGSGTLSGGILNGSAITRDGTLTFGTGLTLNGATVNLTTGAGSGNGLCTITTGGLTLNSGTFNVTAGTTGTGVRGTLNINGNLNLAGGSLIVSNSQQGVVNLLGNFNQTGGNLSRGGTGAASFNLNIASGSRTISQTFGTWTGAFSFNLAGGSSPFLTGGSLNTNINIGSATLNVPSAQTLITNSFEITGGGGVSVSGGGRLRCANVNGLVAADRLSGTIRTTNLTLNSGSIIYFNGTASQITGTGLTDGPSITTPDIYNLNTTSLTLSAPLTVGTLALGYLILPGSSLTLGNNNLTFTTGISAYTSFSGSLMVITNGTGSLIRYITPTGPFNVTFPIGENGNYTPVTVSSITCSATGTLGFRVVDGNHPNLGTPAPAVSISRYWPVTQSGLGTYSFSSNFRYIAADLSGPPESSLVPSLWSPAPENSWTTFAGSGSGGVLTMDGSVTQANAINGKDFTGRSIVNYYYRTRSPQVTNDWATATTWEVSTDINFVSPAPVGASFGPSSSNSEGITIQAGHTVNGTTSGITADQFTINGTLSLNTGGFTINNGTGTDLTISTTGRINLYNAMTDYTSLAGSSTTVNGRFYNQMNSSGTTFSGGYTFSSTATYEHGTTDGGSIPSSTWNTGSTCLISGITNNAIIGQLSQSFHHFTWDCPSQSVAYNLGNNNVAVLGNLTVNNTGTTELRIFSQTVSSSTAASVAGDLIVSGGRLALMGGGNYTVGKTATMTVGRDLLLSNSGVMEMSNGNDPVGNGHVVNLQVGRNISVANTATLQKSRANVTATVLLNAATGAQNFTTHANGINTHVVNFQIGTGTSTNTVSLVNDIPLNSGALLTVQSLASLFCNTYTVSGGTFTLSSGGTLGIGSTAGITSSGATGNIQTTTRNYNTAATYIYNGIINQVTGNGLPNTVSTLTIANLGTSGNNTVTLSTTPTTTTTLNLNSGLLACGNGNTLNIAGGGTIDIPASGGAGAQATGTTAGTINFLGAGNVNARQAGLPQLTNVVVNAISVSFAGPGGNATINGFLELRAGSNVSNAPIYANGSTLIYNTGPYNRQVEWGALSGAGYPYHVRIQGGTTLNANIGALVPATLNLAGNLEIGATGTTGNLDMAGGTKRLIVEGNITIGSNIGASTLTLGGISGPNAGDLEIRGNYTRTANGTILFGSGLGRALFFRGTSNASITSPGTETFPFVIVDKTNGTATTLTLNRPVDITQKFTLSSGRVITNSANLLNITNNAPDGLNVGVAVADTNNNPGYVDGPMRRAVRISADVFEKYLFPVGKFAGGDHYYKRFWMKEIQNDAGTFTAEYFRSQPPGTGTLFFASDLGGILKDEYWDVERTTGFSQLRLVLPYENPGTLGWIDVGKISITPPTESNVAIVKGVVPNLAPPDDYNWDYTAPDSITFNNNGSEPQARAYTIDGDVKSRLITSFSPFTLGYGYNNLLVLPITLEYFRVSLQNGDGVLQWAMADASDLQSFEVEYSRDGQRFSRLATLRGNSNPQYIFRHRDLPEGLHYYRLVMIAKDGSRSFSKIELLQTGRLQTIIIGLLQNPVVGRQAQVLVQSAVNQQADVQVVDLSGRVLLQQKVLLQTGPNQIPVGVTMLPAGQYRLVFRTQDGVQKTLPAVIL